MAENLDALIDALADRVRNQANIGARMPRPNKFVMGQDFQLWLQQFLTYCEAAGIEEEERKANLLSLLDFNTAYKAVANLELDGNLAFEEFTQRLVDRFTQHRTVQDYKVELRGRDQASSESVEDYGDCLRELVRRAYPNLPVAQRDELARDRFLSGVRVSEQVRQNLFLNDPPTLSEAMRRVRQSLASIRAAHLADAVTPATNSGQVQTGAEKG